MSIYLWVALGIVTLIGICHLALLVEAISATYQMLRGRRPDIRKGAWLASGSILHDSIVDTINYQSALDHEQAQHSLDHSDGNSIGDGG
ncbi:hypothetical protein [Armatimonas sp.]|uniref:hypothetical protein n=1 Tax=Armatimonas sp. TaxID=1872638 RepID=UPI003751D077